MERQLYPPQKSTCSAYTDLNRFALNFPATCCRTCTTVVNVLVLSSHFLKTIYQCSNANRFFFFFLVIMLTKNPIQDYSHSLQHDGTIQFRFTNLTFVLKANGKKSSFSAVDFIPGEMEIDASPQGYTVHTENILSTACALPARGQTTCKSLICSVSDVAHKFKFMLFHFVYFRTVTLYATDPAHVCCQHVNMYYICYRQEIKPTVPVIQYPRTDPYVPTPSPPVKLCVPV